MICSTPARVLATIALLTLPCAFSAYAQNLTSGAAINIFDPQTNRFVSANNGGGSSVTVDRTVASGWETFTFTDLTNPSAPHNADRVLLQASNGNYLSAECAGGPGTSGGYTCGNVDANGLSASTWETFTILKVSGSSGLGIQNGDVVYFQSSGQSPGTYQCGPQNSSSAAGTLLTCTGTSPQSSEFVKILVSSNKVMPTDATGTEAAHAQEFLNGFGINTHIDFGNSAYQNLSQVETDIQYIGNGMIRILRDSPSNSNDLTWWPLIHQKTGAVFDAYIGEGGPGIYSAELGLMQQMAQSGGRYIFSFEGGNEEDDTNSGGPVSQGNSQYIAAAEQQTVFKDAKSFGLPVFNISFGAGWCIAPNDPDCQHGDYNTVGDLSAFTDYANAHTYTKFSPNTNGYFVMLNTAASLAASTKPVAITEYGWTTDTPGSCCNVSRNTQAAYVVEGMLDAWNLGNPYYFYYALYDDVSGTFGLASTSGVYKPAATALSVLFKLLGDPGSNALSFIPGLLDYTLTGMPASANKGSIGGQQVLFQKSDGSFWLALWNEQALNNLSGADVSVPAVKVLLNLATQASSIEVYDVLDGSTDAMQSASNTATLSISVPAHPILVKIVRP